MGKKIEQWDIFELSLNGPKEGNPFLEVMLQATFQSGTNSITVTGFYDGDGVYKIRFMPREIGSWTYETESTAKELNGLQGEFDCVGALKGNHGPVRVSDTYHFAYEDGTYHYSFGTTCYVWTHQGDELEELTLKTLKASPFNKIRMCVFPKHYTFNLNDPIYYPFEGAKETGWDFERFNPEFFAHLEKRIEGLRDIGVEADIILFHPYDNDTWGFDKMGMEVNLRYLRYVIARLSSYRNIWWSMANEYDLMNNLNLEDWDTIIKTVAEQDPYQHLRSIHNCIGFYDHTDPLITHASVQQQEVKKVLEWRKEYKKPIVVDECCYEGNIQYVWGNITEQEMTRRFWEGVLRGGYVGHGETYLHENDILWWSKGGELHGKSPERIAFLKSILEEVPREYHNPVTFEQYWEDNSCIGKEGEFYLTYFGIYRPAIKYLQLMEGVQYKIDVIDTWDMTITSLPGTYEFDSHIELPGKQYIALRIQKA